MSCFYEFAHYHIAHKKPFTGESYVAVGGFEKVFAYAFFALTNAYSRYFCGKSSRFKPSLVRNAVVMRSL